jgi:hypothetical protein
MGLDLKRDISEVEAIKHWYETVYLPVIRVIRDTHIMKEFPGRTEGDLYLWVLDHQHYLLEEEGIPLQKPEEAARTFVKKGVLKPTRKKRTSKPKSKKMEKK